MKFVLDVCAKFLCMYVYIYIYIYIMWISQCYKVTSVLKRSMKRIKVNIIIHIQISVMYR